MTESNRNSECGNEWRDFEEEVEKEDDKERQGLFNKISRSH